MYFSVFLPGDWLCLLHFAFQSSNWTEPEDSAYQNTDVNIMFPLVNWQYAELGPHHTGQVLGVKIGLLGLYRNGRCDHVHA